MTWDPSRGQLLGPAWQAIIDNLAQREWGSLEVAISIASQAGPVQRKTARNLIAEGIKHGHLKSRSATTTRGRRYTQIGLTPLGIRAMATVDQAACHGG